MSKQLEKLIEKALYKGEAVVNGRKSYWGGKGELEEKYEISSSYVIGVQKH